MSSSPTEKLRVLLDPYNGYGCYAAPHSLACSQTRFQLSRFLWPNQANENPANYLLGVMPTPRRYRKQIFLIQDIFYRLLHFIRHIVRKMCNSKIIASFEKQPLWLEELKSRAVFLRWVEEVRGSSSKEEFLAASDAPGKPCRALVILQGIAASLDEHSAAKYTDLIVRQCSMDTIVEDGIKRAFTQCEKALNLLYRIRPEEVSSSLNEILIDLLDSDPNLAMAYLELSPFFGVPIEARVILKLLEGADINDERWQLAERIRGGNRTPLENAEIQKAFDNIRNPNRTVLQEIPQRIKEPPPPPPETQLPGNIHER